MHRWTGRGKICFLALFERAGGELGLGGDSWSVGLHPHDRCHKPVAAIHEAAFLLSRADPMSHGWQLIVGFVPFRFVVDIRHHDVIVSTSDIMTPRPALDLLQGTLDLLILRTLEAQPLHGWAIAERIEQISQDVLQVNQGSLYPALHRLEHRGWVRAEWGVSDLGRRARFYRLTAAGRKQLQAETGDWERLSSAINRVLRMA